MILTPPDVKCVICKQIFCCSKCRRKHENTEHSICEIRAKGCFVDCNLCKGYPLHALELKNNHSFVRHLCDRHLPLQCKKCSKIFDSAADFFDLMKCVQQTDHADLNVPVAIGNQSTKSKMTSATSSDTTFVNHSTTDQNYLTAYDDVPDRDKSTKLQTTMAPPKHLLDPNKTDIRNYSSILQTSCNQLKTSPGVDGKALQRHSSTPMIKNSVPVQSPDSMSLSSSQCTVSTIHSMHSLSSSDSDGSPEPPPLVPAAKGVCKMLAPPVIKAPSGRKKLPIEATPLRQIMSKSIQRALREHAGASPDPQRSPMDLRSSPVIRRCNSDPPQMNGSSYKRNMANLHAIKSNQIGGLWHLPARSLSLDTVNETLKDTNKVDCETDGGSTPEAQKDEDVDIWFTPNEYLVPALGPKKSIEYENTPVLPNEQRLKPSSRFKENINRDEYVSPVPQIEKSSINKSYGKSNASSKLWSLVTSVLRFASKSDSHDESIDGSISSNDYMSPVVFKRCASFAGVLRGNPKSPEADVDRQPNKRRRTSTISGPLNETQRRAYRPIRGRQPISRMRTDPLV